MGYLSPGDYNKTIQADNLQQVIGSNQLILSDAEDTAVEKAKSYLVQKYIVTREFAPVTQWDKTKTYSVFNRVYLDAPVYDQTAAYVTGNYVTYQPVGSIYKNVYKSIAGNAAEAFNPAHWLLVNNQYAIYNVFAPVPEFDYKASYNKGDQVFYKGKIYTAAIPSSTVSQDVAIQFFKYDNIPFGNVFPDDPHNGKQYWGAGTAYSVAVNTDILDTTRWVAGDNRCKQVVRAVVCLALYYVHARIAPRNIPELRVKDHDDVIKELREFANGDTTANLPLIQPRQGMRIRYGGNVKNQNNY